MRQIVLDTETTGLSPEEGHRIIEIGCVELANRRFTGNNFQHYINPQREVDKGAQQVHGLTSEFLKDKPVFDVVVDELIAYISDAELIIHNAPFDVGFLNHELMLCNRSFGKVHEYSKIFDTLALARSLHPGKKNSLDALCKRYNIDNSKRQLHGALLDAQILAEVYLAMTGGQRSIFAEPGVTQDNSIAAGNSHKKIKRNGESLLVINATPEELQAHQEIIEAIKSSN